MPTLPPRSPLRADDPRRLGRYTLAGRLGRGAQGVVYLARTPDGRVVALKLLHEDRTARPGSRDRLAKEAATARRVRGQCTARILDVDVSGPRPYIVTEYVAGPSLHRRVRERGPLSGAALDRLMIGTATALVAIHSAGIVHRDLKPANVLLGPEGPRVIDFGVAHVEDSVTTLTGTPVGTPAYMAPEQVAGDPAGCPADVFSWASTMVYAATGEAPFGRDNASAVMNRIAHHDPDLTGLRGPVLTLLSACLHKQATDRPPAEHVLRRLLELSTRKPTTRSRAAIRAAGIRAATSRDRAPHDRDPEDQGDRNRRARSDRDPDGRGRDDRGGRNVPDWMRRTGPPVRHARDLPSRSKGAARARARDEAEDDAQGGGRSPGTRGPAPRGEPGRSGRRPARTGDAPDQGRAGDARPGEARADAPGPRRPGGASNRGRADAARADASGARQPGDARGRGAPARGPDPRRPARGREGARERDEVADSGRVLGGMSPGRRRGYVIAVIITILIGLTMGITYPWANPGRTPAPGASATP